MRTSYSAEGEDILISKLFARCFPDVKWGIYVDIGAHHPWLGSNTALLHEKGWSGVNVDPLPGCMEAFHQARPFDTNLEVACGDGELEVRYARYDRPELNCLVPAGEEPLDCIRGSQLLSCGKVPVYSPSKVTWNVGRVDFLNLDVEGSELDILRKWPWDNDRLCPKVICVEDNGWPMDLFGHRADGGPLREFLEGHDYVPVSRLLCSVVYVQVDKVVWR